MNKVECKTAKREYHNGKTIFLMIMTIVLWKYLIKDLRCNFDMDEIVIIKIYISPRNFPEFKSRKNNGS